MDQYPYIVFVALHVSAFVIGGYAKAKEGIIETIKEKDLNVELLMFIAAIGFWTEGAILFCTIKSFRNIYRTKKRS